MPQQKNNLTSTPIQNAASAFDWNCSLVVESKVMSMNYFSSNVMKSAGVALKGSRILHQEIFLKMFLKGRDVCLTIHFTGFQKHVTQICKFHEELVTIEFVGKIIALFLRKNKDLIS